MKSRYDKKTLNEINRIVKNYNRRVDRIAKNDTYGIAFIPEKTSVKDILNLPSKVDINRRLRDLESYNKKTAETVVTRNGKSLSLYEYNLNKKYREILRRNINKKMKFYESNFSQTRGKKETVSLARSGNREYLNLVAKKEKLLKTNIIDLDYKTLLKNTENKNYSIWQQNYISILDKVAQTYQVGNISHITSNLLKLTPSQFNKFSKLERTIQQIVYYYHVIADVGINYALANYRDDVASLFNVLNSDIERLIKEYS